MVDEAIEQKRGPGRPPKDRAEAIKERRRKRNLRDAGGRLGVNLEAMDRQRFKYRWINDEEFRFFAKTQQDDWTPVYQSSYGEVKDITDLSSAVSVVVGKKEDGSPMRAYLCRKPRQWWEDDQRQKVEDIERMLDEMRAGNDPDGSRPENTYALPGNHL